MKLSSNLRLTASAGLLLFSAVALIADILPGQTEIVSTTADGVQGDKASFCITLAGNGRYVFFISGATNLVPGLSTPTNLFVKDRDTGLIHLVNRTLEGKAAGGLGNVYSVSADGRYAAFTSDSAKLVPGDTNLTADVFVMDLATSKAKRASVAADGTEANGSSYGPAISADGRYVAFSCGANNLVAGRLGGLFVKDLATGKLWCASDTVDGLPDNGYSNLPMMSWDGRFVAFRSTSTNLAPGDTNGCIDIYLKDLLTGEVRAASVTAAGKFGNADAGLDRPSMSWDGRYVAFQSAATNLFTFDGNNRVDAFVKDMVTGTLTCVSLTAKGYVGNKQSYDPRLNADGRFVSFPSQASDLVVGDTNGFADVFVKDLKTGTVHLATISSSGVQANQHTQGFGSDITQDGRMVAFSSNADNLVPVDTNGTEMDVFIHGTPFSSGRASALSISAEPAYLGMNLNAVFTLKDRASGLPIAGAPLKLSIDWAQNVAPTPTNASGKVKGSIPLLEGTPVGPISLRAFFAGDDTNAFAAASRLIMVRPGPVRIRVAPKTSAPTKWIPLTAKLTNWAYQPLSGRTLSFSAIGMPLGDSVTDAKGVATKWFKVPTNTTAWTYSVDVAFAGDEGHLADSGSGGLTIQ